MHPRLPKDGSFQNDALYAEHQCGDANNMTDPSTNREAIHGALGGLVWSVSRTSQAWSQEELFAKRTHLPERLEVREGMLCKSLTDRLRLLASLLENVGLDVTWELIRAMRARSIDQGGLMVPSASTSGETATALGSDNYAEIAGELKARAPSRTWNYRAIRFEHGEDSHVAIHEVHYTDGRPVAHGERAAPLMWFEQEGMATGFRVLGRLREALDKPVLSEEDFCQPGCLLGFPPGLELPSDFDLPPPHDGVAAFESGNPSDSRKSVNLPRAEGGHSVDVGDELLLRQEDRGFGGWPPSNTGGDEGGGREMAGWDNMPAVGRERFWMPAANRYPLKTLIALKKSRWGDRCLVKDCREAKRSRMKQFIRKTRCKL